MDAEQRTPYRVHRLALSESKALGVLQARARVDLFVCLRYRSVGPVDYGPADDEAHAELVGARAQHAAYSDACAGHWLRALVSESVASVRPSEPHTVLA